MIKVVFKKDRENGFGTQEFTYSDFEGANKDDIVAVETRYGYAIAKVTATNVIDERFTNTSLAKVICIVEGPQQREAKIKKAKYMAEMKEKVKIARLYQELEKYFDKEACEEIKAKLTIKEIEDLIKDLD